MVVLIVVLIVVAVLIHKVWADREIRVCAHCHGAYSQYAPEAGRRYCSDYCRKQEGR